MRDVSSFLKREDWAPRHEQPAEPVNGRSYFGKAVSASEPKLKKPVEMSANAKQPQPGGDGDPVA